MLIAKCILIAWGPFVTSAVVAIATIVVAVATRRVRHATADVAVATKDYVKLVREQLCLSEPRVFPYIATRSGHPHVNVTNAGGATAYKVSVKIHWPEPPEEVEDDRKPDDVESPEVGKLSAGETISFKSPHKIVAKDHLKRSGEYVVKVKVEYEGRGEKRFGPNEVDLDFGKYMTKKNKSKMKARPG